MEHETILQMGSDRILLRYAYHKQFTVKFPDSYERQNGFNPDNKCGLVCTQMGTRPIKALVLVCIDGAQEGATASVWSPYHSIPG
jgi:hypothetical protein